MARARTRVPRRTLVEGFEASRVRLNTAIGRSDPDDAFIALFEVVAWAGAIGDWFQNRRRTRKATTPTTPAEIQGLWYVRNRVLHFGSDALLQGTLLMPTLYGAGTYGTATFGGSYPVTTWTWKPSHRLPRGRSNAGKTEYDSLLAGNQVAKTLETVSSELARRVRKRA